MTLNRREVLSIGCGLAGSAWLAHTGFAQAPSGGSPASVASGDPFAYVNPEFRPTLEQLVKATPPGFGFNPTTLPLIRKRSENSAHPILPSPVVEEKMIPGPAGSPDVRVYVVGATPGASKPAVLNIHGGGYIAGTAAASKRDMQEISNTHDCVAVSVDYRLAPETTSPGSLDDNYAALRWLCKNAKELGVDTKRIAIKGESAGGGHAAALAIAARDRGEFPICLQVLIYPMLDDRTGSVNRVPPYLGHFLWTEQDNRFGWSSLLGVSAGSANVPPNSVPARVGSVAGLPPAFIGVGSIDLFCPEDVSYASRLVLAGISTELHIVPGAFHAFDLLVPTAPLSVQFIQAWNDALKRAFTTA
jgi:acetyl esterase/lipase